MTDSPSGPGATAEKGASPGANAAHGPGAAVDTSPFDLGGSCDRAVPAVLCLHGLTGTPYEVRPLGEALARRGFRAYGPCLPGHDSTPEALSALPYTAWLDAVQRDFDALRARHERAFAVGLSLGALLTLALAARGGPEAVAVIGAPLRFPAPIPQLLPLVKHLKPMLKKRGGSDIREKAARERHPGYQAMPLKSVHELVKLQQVVKDGLGKIRVPAFVAHGVHDETANPRDARTIHAALEKSELMMLERSGHVVPVDHDGPRLAEAVADFIEKQL